MPRGRKPSGERARTGAERQALYRARHPIGQIRPAIQPQSKPSARRSRPQRWRAAIAELVAIQAEYAAWLEAMPEVLHASPTAEVLQAVLDLDLDELAAVELPRGFGRD